MERKFKLIPIHPFTNRQAEIIELKLKGVTSLKQIARELGISYETVKTHIYGLDPSAVLDTKGLTINDINRSELGILGIIEVLTGKRPGRNLLGPLLGDVILETNTSHT